MHTRTGGLPDFVSRPRPAWSRPHARVYRVDAKGARRALRHEGEAALEAEREVRAGAGERVYARQGEPTDDPQGFDRAAVDDFDRWDADHEDRQAYAVNRRSYLPEAVLPYAGELDAYGAWYYQTEIGHVWRPYVASGWRPIRRPRAGRHAAGRGHHSWAGALPLRPLGLHAVLGWYWIPATAVAGW